MHFTELRARMPGLLASGVSVELISAPGRGKSEFVRQTVRTMSERDGEPWGYAELFLATQTPPDLIGYMFKGEVEYDGTRYSVTDPTMPTWFMTTDGKPVFAYRRGILFLDEFGQGQTDVKAAAAELLLNRRLGSWRLPDGWSVVAASNRTSDRSGVTKSLDFVINRRMEIHITDDLASWERWALENEIHPSVISFAMKNPHIVFTDGVPERQGPWCTPRSLVMAERVLRAQAGGDALPVDQSWALELAAGLIGEAAAAQLFAELRLAADMPDYATIVKDPAKAELPAAPDVQMLLAYHLAALVEDKDLKPVIAYAERMGMEMAMLFAKALCRRKPKTVASQAFMDWTMRNPSIVSVMA